MTESITLTPKDVADKVRPYLIGRHIGDISLTLDENRIHLRNDYWRIPIRPSRWPEKMFAYYEELADLEEEVQEKEGIKVTMASGDPIDEE
jgi:hypothetical protein